MNGKTAKMLRKFVYEDAARRDPAQPYVETNKKVLMDRGKPVSESKTLKLAPESPRRKYREMKRDIRKGEATIKRES